MKQKRDVITKSGIFGAVLGFIYFMATFRLFDKSTLLIFLSTILYFSLLGLLFSIAVLLVSKGKLEKWHLGALFGYITYILTSVLLFLFADVGGEVSFLYDVIFLGPIPGFLLQICLILLGLGVGMYLSNTSIIKLRIRK